MEITQSVDGVIATLAVKGKINTATAPQLNEAVETLLGQVDQIVFDFAELEYLSSAGLRVLLGAQKKLAAKGGVIVRNVNETIMEILDATGFSMFLTIE